MKLRYLSMIVCLFLTSCGQTIHSKTNLTVGEIKKTPNKEVTYLEVTQPHTDSQIIFIHGSPGEKEGYLDYLSKTELQSKATLISIDRIGFGQSKLTPEPSIIAQAQAIAPLLSQNTILVGHSLGGPIALQVALLYPEQIKGMIIVAPAFDPSLEEPKWYNWLAAYPPVSWVLSEPMLTSNKEMMPLADELTKLAEKNWNNLNMPITLIHGEEDSIADPRNSLFAMKLLPESNTKLIMAQREGHFVLWQNVELISREIELILDRVNAINLSLE
ncbi:alpha/beta hydrolase [Vibrio sp. Of7-15]|uniref:alpha/beta fold hydrolase n=1 Tax=Vibrio sp. Of7-15 TaxID=2724879 RepID=UPI001EF2F406|nr:alpha/beta hydrolase [Vibrio sp. Of7-15]MCG7495541.1 alpha/beta hydrolase [Vibrio sp. Of7-15]